MVKYPTRGPPTRGPWQTKGYSTTAVTYYCVLHSSKKREMKFESTPCSARHFVCKVLMDNEPQNSFQKIRNSLRLNRTGCCKVKKLMELKLNNVWLLVGLTAHTSQRRHLKISFAEKTALLKRTFPTEKTELKNIKYSPRYWLYKTVVLISPVFKHISRETHGILFQANRQNTLS